jgi:hypothetical protein
MAPHEIIAELKTQLVDLKNIRARGACPIKTYCTHITPYCHGRIGLCCTVSKLVFLVGST